MVGPATRIPAAIALIENEDFDVVLLDVNLDGEMSWEVAASLKAHGIPFVLSTGYEVGNLYPDFPREVKVIKKPFKIDELENFIYEAIKIHAENIKNA